MKKVILSMRVLSRRLRLYSLSAETHVAGHFARAKRVVFNFQKHSKRGNYEQNRSVFNVVYLLLMAPAASAM